MKTTLLIMAAGIGSRFGTGIKQLAKVDNSNHIIMDYSIHDAIEAGFNKIIFIIRRDIEEEFKSVIGDRIEKTCAENNVEVDYAYQSLSSIPELNETTKERIKDRTKPWGTGQAVLAAKDKISTPFAVSITFKFCTFFTLKKCTDITDVSLRVNRLFLLSDNFHQLSLQL